MLITKKILVLIFFLSFNVFSQDEGFAFETLEPKEYALFQCIQQNHEITRVYERKKEESYFNDASFIKRGYSVDSIFSLNNFIENEVKKYHETSLYMHFDESDDKDMNMIFSLCIKFYKSKRLDDFLKKIKMQEKN